MKMREVFHSSETWIKYSRGRDANDNDVGYGNHPNAVKWCLLGGIDKCYGHLTKEYQEIKNKIADLIGFTEEEIQLAKKSTISEFEIDLCIANWNNAPERTFGDIRRIVELLEPEVAEKLMVVEESIVEEQELMLV